MGGNFSRVNEYEDGDTYTAANVEEEIDNIITNSTPAGQDDASSNVTAMRTTADPYPASVASLAISTAEELHRLRYQILGLLKVLKPSITYWYEDAGIVSAVLTSPILTTPQINDTSLDHQYIFTVSELAADRNVNLPLLTGDDEFVLKDHAVVMTNKTLTSPILNTPSSSGHVYSGTYTPTGTAVANLDNNPTALEAQYLRVGNTVTVSGALSSVDPTASATLTTFRLSLPIVSNLASAADLSGVGTFISDTAGSNESFAIYAEAGTDTALFLGYPIDTSTEQLYYTFTYQII